MTLEKTPPHHELAEQAVLGAMLLDSRAIAVALQYLTADSFYFQKHRIIFNAIIELYNHSATPDVVTVHNKLASENKITDIGGAEYLSYLQSVTPTTANIEEYCQVVLEKATLRKLIEAATDIVKSCYDAEHPADELLDSAEQKIFDIKAKGLRKDLTPLQTVLTETVRRLEQSLTQERGAVTGIQTGFAKLDQLTSGFQAGDLIIIAGRPSSGKTALALNIATYAADWMRRPVAIFSLEMTQETLIERILCAEAQLSFQKLRRGGLEQEEWIRLTSAVERLQNLPIYIDDSAAMKVLEIKAKARRLAAEMGDLGIIFIDYLQLIEPQYRSHQKSRQQEITEISRALKGLAKELNVPVVAISQLSRLPERRQDKRPQLADLRESGAIEQDADLVLLLYRPEIYEEFQARPEYQGWAEIIIAKQRNGPQGTIRVGYRKEWMRFTVLDETMIPEMEANPEL
ncbi:MAG: replicative DNA helicase [candidate division WOR-3 bacterium]